MREVLGSIPGELSHQLRVRVNARSLCSRNVASITPAATAYKHRADSQSLQVKSKTKVILKGSYLEASADVPK